MKSLLAALLLLSIPALSQTPTDTPAGLHNGKSISESVDVVSIKPNTTGKMVPPCCGFVFDTYGMSNQPIEETIKAAYFQPMMRSHVELVGAPSWVRNEKYDIVAKVDADTAARFKAIPHREWYTASQPLLQSMLAERFGLIAHRIPVEVEGYALVVGKRGAKLTRSQPGDVAPPDYRDMGGGKAHLIKKPGSPPEWDCIGVPIASMIDLIGGMSDTVIVDQTGLEGTYNFKLVYLDQDPAMSAAGNEGTVSSSRAFTWDLDRLGLQLKPAKIKTETVVIDHIDHPSPN